MGDEYYEFEADTGRPLSAAARQRQARADLERLTREGEIVTPVVSRGRVIATGYWGRAWCVHWNDMGVDLARLAFGRSCLHSGCVIDLKCEGRVARAKVSGKTVYDVAINFAAIDPAQWQRIKDDISRHDLALVDLLAGKVPTAVQETLAVTSGIFPDRREARASCTCLDSDDWCKHAAAVIYGIAVRIDQSPALVFRLRGVEAAALVRDVAHDRSQAAEADGSKLGNDELADIFGIAIDDSSFY